MKQSPLNSVGLARQRRQPLLLLPLMLALWPALVSCGRDEAPAPPTAAGPNSNTESGYAYFNDLVTNVPWSVHVIRFERSRPDLELHSIHALGQAVGLSTLSEQVGGLPRQLGQPIAAVNGDFYQTDERNPYGGDPRGLQIIDGELISAPTDQVSFWIDAGGQPRMEHIESQFKVTWPDRSSAPLGLNEERGPSQVVLYTPRLGTSTRTSGSGLELILEPEAGGPWLPLRPGMSYTAKVKEVRQTGNSPMSSNFMVLSIGPSLSRAASGPGKVSPGATLEISTATVPDLKGVRTAISGGNVLVHNGKKETIQVPSTSAYKYRSMFERHPRSAIGANEKYYFLVEVDGRQPRLSMGMTLSELADYLLKVGCTQAMSLDGGASSTFWLEGKVMNSPCHGRERTIANGLVLMQKGKRQTDPQADRPQSGS